MSNNETTFILGWYAIECSKHIKSKPLAIRRFGLPLVLWRLKDKSLVCMLDRCPHRSAKLSLGKIRDNCIECPYHGFKFDIDGLCQFAPEFNKAIPGLQVETFSVVEALGMVWFHYGEQEDEFDFSELIKLDASFKGQYSQTERTWNSHITYCIENQLDYTHLPDVHHNTIGKNFKIPTTPEFLLSEDKISVYLDKSTPALSYYFPNIWVLNVAKEMKLMVFFAPIDDKNTRLYVRTYNPLLKMPILSTMIAPLFNGVNCIVLKQDQRVVQSQGTGASFFASSDMLMKHDKAIRYFREVWQNKLTFQS